MEDGRHNGFPYKKCVSRSGEVLYSAGNEKTMETLERDTLGALKLAIDAYWTPAEVLETEGL